MAKYISGLMFVSFTMTTGGRLWLQPAPTGSDHAHQDSEVSGMCLRLWGGAPRAVWRSPQDAGQTSTLEDPFHVQRNYISRS